MIHIGCWIHARRKFIDALQSDRSAMEIINMIVELFKLELAFKIQKLTPDQIKVQWERRSKIILSKETYDKRQLLPCYIKI